MPGKELAGTQKDCRTRTTKRTSNGRELRRDASDRDRTVWSLVADGGSKGKTAMRIVSEIVGASEIGSTNVRCYLRFACVCVSREASGVSFSGEEVQHLGEAGGGSQAQWVWVVDFAIKSIPWRPQRFGLTRGHIFSLWIWCVLDLELLSWSGVTGPTDGSYIVHRSSVLEDGVWGCSLSSVAMSPRRYLEHGFLHPPLLFAVDFVTNATGRVLAVEQSVYSWIVDVSFG
ncbi:hypothetical protein DY000_02054005 [Brassica cretica]|uniref:DUF1618 domain-containing protein n=1 Tax=Brassica cretica TaxID=69181 RepID=A0ABQ7AFZ8_BRACR|nr:hypothetical protein DY000_02054005 [Brassica cretica]